MILLNTPPANTNYDISSGTEAQLKMDSANLFFRNETGRPVKMKFRVEISTKTANDLTDTATYKIRLYHGDTVTFGDAALVTFSAGTTIANFITYVCAVAESLTPTFVFNFPGFVAKDDEYVFITMESDNAGDNDVQVTEFNIFEDTDFISYSASGLNPNVNVDQIADAVVPTLPTNFSALTPKVLLLPRVILAIFSKASYISVITSISFSGCL